MKNKYFRLNKDKIKIKSVSYTNNKSIKLIYV